jgi:hypothetical protein
MVARAALKCYLLVDRITILLGYERWRLRTHHAEQTEHVQLKALRIQVGYAMLVRVQEPVQSDSDDVELGFDDDHIHDYAPTAAPEVDACATLDMDFENA